MGKDKSIISPCRRICTLEEGVCVGCGRTRFEIKEWKKMSNARRKMIMNRLEGSS